MSRAFCFSGVFFLLVAFVLSLLTSISLPFLPALDITRSHFGNGTVNAGQQGMTELRFGVWAPCYYDQNGHRTCDKASHGYSIDISNQNKSSSIKIGASWTRGLAIHPVAAVVTFVALLLSLSQHAAVTLFASLTSFLAAFLTLIAFACDIALFAYLKQQAGKLSGVVAHTTPGAGFWMTLTSFLLLLLAGCTVCLGRRRRTDGGTPYSASSKPTPSFWSRFRKN